MTLVDASGKALRTESHEIKLDMLFQWLCDEHVLEAIQDNHVAAQKDIVRLVARLAATVATPEAGTAGRPGIDERAVGEFIYMLLDDRRVGVEIAKHVRRRYGVTFRNALRELRAMKRELEAEQPVDEEPVEPKDEAVH